MASNWKPTADGKMILEQKGPKTARLIGGAIMGLVAAFFAYATWVTLQAALITESSFGKAVMSASINLLITLVLGIGAFLLILMRARIIFDPKTEEIQTVRDFRITQRADKYTFRDVVSVQIKDESKRANEKSHSEYAVNLLLKNRQVIPIVRAPDKAQARELSERLAKLLRVKVEEFPLLQAKAAVEK